MPMEATAVLGYIKSGVRILRPNALRGNTAVSRTVLTAGRKSTASRQAWSQSLQAIGRQQSYGDRPESPSKKQYLQNQGQRRCIAALRFSACSPLTNFLIYPTIACA